MHICEFCERRIETGESAERVYFVNGGDVGSYYLCDWCAEHISDLHGGGEYEFSRGDLYEYVNDARCGKKCPNCSGKDYDWKINTKRGVVLLTCKDYIVDEPCGHVWEINLDALFGFAAQKEVQP